MSNNESLNEQDPGPPNLIGHQGASCAPALSYVHVSGAPGSSRFAVGECKRSRSRRRRSARQRRSHARSGRVAAPVTLRLVSLLRRSVRAAELISLSLATHFGSSAPGLTVSRTTPGPRRPALAQFSLSLASHAGPRARGVPRLARPFFFVMTQRYAGTLMRRCN